MSYIPHSFGIEVVIYRKYGIQKDKKSISKCIVLNLITVVDNIFRC